MTRARLKLGQEAEDAAADFLIAAGYQILDRRYRNQLGEIDLIAKHRSTLVFIEVKAKTGTGQGSPEEMVDRRKQRQLTQVIKWYLMELGTEPACRIDVIALQWNKGSPIIHHILNAFEVTI